MKQKRCKCGGAFKPANEVLDEARLFQLGFRTEELVCESCYRTLEEVMS